jgi:hypothetical protein
MHLRLLAQHLECCAGRYAPLLYCDDQIVAAAIAHTLPVARPHLHDKIEGPVEREVTNL